MNNNSYNNTLVDITYKIAFCINHEYRHFTGVQLHQKRDLDHWTSIQNANHVCKSLVTQTKRSGLVFTVMAFWILVPCYHLKSIQLAAYYKLNMYKSLLVQDLYLLITVSTTSQGILNCSDNTFQKTAETCQHSKQLQEAFINLCMHIYMRLIVAATVSAIKSAYN